MRKGIIIVLFLISIFIIPFVIFSLQFFAFDPGNGGPVVSYEPSTEYNVGVPVLDEISISGGSIRLSWSLETGYTITGFYVFICSESAPWSLLEKLGNVYSYSRIISDEMVFSFRVMGIATIDGEEHNSQFSNVQSAQVSLPVITIPTLKAIESPNTDGIIELDWDTVSNPADGIVCGYLIYRQFGSGGWIEIGEVLIGITDYTDNVNVNGTYQYYIKTVMFSYRFCIETISEPSNIQSVVVGIYVYVAPPPEAYPSNPSISINDGDETSDSFEVTLTLYCDNAEEMQFQISVDIWTNWTVYATTYTITLFVNDPDYPEYRVGAVFRNGVGTTEDAGYGDIYDDITYEPEVVPPPPPPPPNGDVDYTLMYVLLGVLASLIGIGIFLKYRKQIIKSK